MQTAVHPDHFAEHLNVLTDDRRIRVVFRLQANVAVFFVEPLYRRFFADEGHDDVAVRSCFDHRQGPGIQAGQEAIRTGPFLIGS